MDAGSAGYGGGAAGRQANVLVWGNCSICNRQHRWVVEEEMETMDLVVNLAGVALAVLDLSLSHTILDKYLKT